MNKRDKESGGLYAALSAYSGSDYYPCHMPGHKRSKAAGDMARYYDIDITEIDGFDDLHHAEGILRDAMAPANEIYGAGETFYLVNGSTGGVLASIMTAAERGSEILIARNCHRSVYHAAVMQELTLRYCYPPLLEEYDICDGVPVREIERLLERYPDCRAVVVTSPTYEGIVSDIGAIAEAVHARDKILIVDEAHGAHFGLDKNMPEGAVAQGADLVIHSLHKTLPAMTQTALLHVQGDRVDQRKLRAYLRMLQTSSPSYVMMASMDSCMRYVRAHGAERFAFMRRQYELFCSKTDRCRYIHVGRMSDLAKKPHHLTDWDIGKLVIFTRHPAYNGRRLYDILRQEYHLQLEMAAGDYAVAIMSMMDDKEGWQRLADALVQIDDRIERESLCAAVQSGQTASLKADGRMEDGAPETVKPVAVMRAADAFFGRREEVELSCAAGRVAADFIDLYPPGVPLLVPGEIISGGLIARIEACRHMGLRVRGVSASGKTAVLAEY